MIIPFDAYELHRLICYEDGSGTYDADDFPDEDHRLTQERMIHWRLSGHRPGMGTYHIGEFDTLEDAIGVLEGILGRPCHTFSKNVNFMSWDREAPDAVHG